MVVFKLPKKLRALFFLHATQLCKEEDGKLLDFSMIQVKKTATVPRFVNDFRCELEDLRY